MDKAAIIDQLFAVLEAELSQLTRAANEAYAAATDPDSKAENKYDTRSLEASYVARGQAQRVLELQEGVMVFATMSRQNVAPDSAIAVGALVTINQTHYLIAAHAGGTEVQHKGEDIYVITPGSPLGQKLIGKVQGAVIALRPGTDAVIDAVC